MTRIEHIVNADYNTARRYLRKVLSHPRISDSSVSGLFTKAALEAFGSLDMDAQEQSLDESAQLRVYRLEQVAVALKRRQDPSSLVSRWILDEVTSDMAQITEKGARNDIDSAVRRVKVRNVAFLEAEKIIAPMSAWIRTNWRI